MLKRNIHIIFVIFFILTVCLPSALAEFDLTGISTEHVLLMEAESGKVLFEKSGFEKAYPASTTKILTCIIALEQGNLDEIVMVGPKVEDRGSQMGIIRYEELTLRDLIYGMMLVSGNDAARAIAEHIAGSQENFADMMNEKARLLGMNQSNFVMPNGLHDDNHYSTAYDMAILTRYAMQNPEYREIVSCTVYEVPPTNKDSNGYTLENSNRLIYQKENDKASYLYEYASGGKTGDTRQAGRCLVATAEYNDVELIVVLLGDYENKVDGYYRYETATNLFNWGFENYITISAAELNLQSEFKQDVLGENNENSVIRIKADLDNKTISGLKTYIQELKENSSLIKTNLSTTNLTKPVSAGDIVGTISYEYNGEIFLNTDLIAAQDYFINETHNNPIAEKAAAPEISREKDTASDKNSIWIIISLIVIFICITFSVLYIIKRRKQRARRQYKKYTYRHKK